MGRLIYLTPTSLDGFISDGDYSWSAPDEEVMAALTADFAEVSTYLYGRRMYETMAVLRAPSSLVRPLPGCQRTRPVARDCDQNCNQTAAASGVTDGFAGHPANSPSTCEGKSRPLPGTATTRLTIPPR